MSDALEPTDVASSAVRRGEDDNLILIGLRGSGKSVVGRVLAERLGRVHVDTDELLERQSGRTIREIFEEDGEAGFRVLERQVVEQVVRARRQVISVGGGAILSAHNRRLLQGAGVCVWLSASTEELHRRLQADARTHSQRPPLTDLSGVEEIRQMLQTRGSLYAATATHVVDTSGRSVAEVADVIIGLASSPPDPTKGT